MSTSFQLSDRQRVVLKAIFDTLIAPIGNSSTSKIVREQSSNPLTGDEAQVKEYCELPGSLIPGAFEAVERALSTQLPPELCSELGMLLSVMDTAPGMFALSGYWASFPSMDATSRQTALAGFSTSVIAPKRKAFKALKTLVILKVFGTGATNPLWGAVGYEGPASQSQAAAAQKAAGRAEYPFRMLNDAITGPTVLDTFDVVVVGSGCGGAVVAAELAKDGHRVLVLEKGEYVPKRDLTGQEEEFDRLYERGGLVATEDTAMGVLAGSTFGGGSTVNWACSLRTPHYVREEWANEKGLPYFLTPSFQASLDAVCGRIGVQEQGVVHNVPNAHVIASARACGVDVSVAPQNMSDVTKGAGAGGLGLGDMFGAKNSMGVTYLVDAASAPVPAQFLQRCKVERVTQEKGRVTGVVAKVQGVGGNQHRLEVKASCVVVAAGSINSPALLLRSKLPGVNQSGMVGKNLHLHPVTGCIGIMPDAVDVWKGAPMTTVSNAVAAGPTGDHYGAKLECPSVLPGLLSSLLPWEGGEKFKRRMLDARRVLPIIVLVRDKGCGEVVLDARGDAKLYYPFNEDHDRRSMVQGLETAVRLAAAAGAEQITTGQRDVPFVTLPPPPPSPPVSGSSSSLSAEEQKRRLDLELARVEAVEEVVRLVRSVGVAGDFKTDLFSAHQMGTCCMGSRPSNSVVDVRGESWSIKGLYVADASTFPSPSGANPMVTTLAIAHGIAQGLKRELGRKKVAGARSRL